MESLEVLEVVIWPLVTLLVTLFLIWILKEELRAFVSKITKVKLLGSEVTAASQELSTGEEARESIAPVAEKAVPGVKKNRAMAREEEVVREQLATVSPDERENRLIVQLASERLLLRYDRCHRVIYTSQLVALQYLKAREQHSAPTETIETFWDAAKLANPGKTFEAWLSFLINWGLVEKGPQGAIKITDYGLLYLDQITAMGWSLTPNIY